MDNSYIKNNLEQIFESFKEMIKVETVVGQAVPIGDAILVIKGDRVEMFSIKKDGYQASAFEKLIAMAPEIIDKMKKDKYIYIHDDEEDKTEGDDEKA